jgi:hypothetical protein
MLLKSSRGQVLEDIDNYDTLCRIFQNMKSEATLKGEATSSKDIRAVDVAKNFTNMTNANGQNVRHHLMSGILGDHQEFLIPISALAAGSGFAFQLELFLNDDAKVVGSTNTSAASYSLEEVSYDMELVEVSDAIQADINSELASGSQIPLPYKSWRSFNTALSGAGTQHQSTLGLEQHATPVGSPLVGSKQLSTAALSAALSANGSGFVHFLISSRVTVSRSASVSLESKMSTSPM